MAAERSPLPAKTASKYATFYLLFKNIFLFGCTGSQLWHMVSGMHGLNSCGASLVALQHVSREPNLCPLHCEALS